MPGTTTTVGDVVNQVITELSQVPGLATQIYSVPRIRQLVEDAMKLEIEEMWWPNLMWFQKVTLDGVNGFITNDLKGPISFIDRYEDIQAVFPDQSNIKIPELPQSVNPFNIGSVASRPTFISADYTVPHRPFRVWPATTTGNVVVAARQSCTFPMGLNDEVYLDPLLLAYDACWMYVVDDGTVPAQVNKFQMLAVKRRKQMFNNMAQKPLLLDPRFPADPNLIDEMVTGTFTLNQSVLG